MFIFFIGIQIILTAGENFDDSLQGNENIQLRGYQKELVQPAKDKKNVIICAPPGFIFF